MGLVIISGGQTGADRAALDWAIENGVPQGGWCPKGRWAEDGAIAPKYNLRETPTTDPGQRTEWNVRDSDGTLIFSLRTQLTGGTRLTFEKAHALAKPCLCFNQTTPDAANLLRHFIAEHRISKLNIAGPRESEQPGIGEFVRTVLADFHSAAPGSTPHCP